MSSDPVVQPAVLTSWKEIAQYIGKSVRSVQRWEQHFGLPVKRPLGARSKSAVLAQTAELDRWIMSSWARRGEQRRKQEQSAPKILAAADRHAQLLEQVRDAVKSSVRYRSAQRDLLGELQECVSALKATSMRLSEARRQSALLATMAMGVAHGTPLLQPDTKDREPGLGDPPLRVDVPPGGGDESTAPKRCRV